MQWQHKSNSTALKRVQVSVGTQPKSEQSGDISRALPERSERSAPREFGCDLKSAFPETPSFTLQACLLTLVKRLD